MNTRQIAFLLGTVLSTGMLMAQQTTPAPDAIGQQTPQTQPNANGPRHTMDPNKQAHHLAKELGLNSQQVAQIKPILADRQQQVQAVRADNTLAQQDRRAKIQAIQQDSKSKIEAVLNDTQKQQFEQMLANRKAQHKPQGQQGS